ncbi:GDSL esterase/lipase [Pyrus ussuriensis x Pyrus communis]|uniref:GDSL esterase/lipase n=1 Tax=Pyrus ussuriensis x Pyrus communis TaxID=2448454 RepID=A0A5N5G0L3_9ROSA|nr:GDSL esterase/lipase [Pyrus ussuriensis x Pyrus communis]
MHFHSGNNDYIFTLSKAASPPYGIDFKPSGGRPTGRFTNGRTISDIIGRVPLREQVNNFEESRNNMVKTMGENNTMEFLKKTTFSVAIGFNDVLNYFQPSIPFFVLTIKLKRLHELGARKFVVAGIGPLGCIPFIRAISLSGRCFVEVNEIIQGYNMKLNGVLDQLNQELGPEAIFLYANSFDIFMKIIVNYHQYGCANVNEPCCGGYFPLFVCFKSRDANRSSALCDDRSKYVFWDAYHPTEAGNMIIAERLLDGDMKV